MSDLFKHITSLVSPLDETSDPTAAISAPTLSSLFKFQPRSADKLREPVIEKEEIPVTRKEPQDSPKDNLDALKRLRSLPRGTQVDSRIAAVKALLGENEIFKTLKMLRWPHGVMCPRCHSSNVVRRDPPPDAIDQRHHYECLNCKGEGTPSDFDDFTGLPIGSLHGLSQWILCWYLIGFCSVAQISKVLGISINDVLQMAAMGSEMAELRHDDDPSAKMEKLQKEKEKKASREKSALTQEYNEELTRSASKSPLKPGYKSKK